MSTKSLLPVPVFHDDHLSHSFKQANDSFRQRRPPKLYPKHVYHHHHHHHHIQQQPHNAQTAATNPTNNYNNGAPASSSSAGTSSRQLNHSDPMPYCCIGGTGLNSTSHQQHHHNLSTSNTSGGVFNKSLSVASSSATSVSFVSVDATNNNLSKRGQFVGPAVVSAVCTHRPLSSPHYRADRPETYFEQCFVVLTRLGEGSFSEVFRVRCRDDGLEYAVKRSRQPYKSERYREERLEEVRRYEQLAHQPHCLRLHFAWEQDDHLYMQLELCRESVDAFVLRQRGVLAEPLVWSILGDLLLGIRALHERDLLHLDVKLENVMMDERGRCKLGDFGLVVDLNKPNLHQSCEGDSRYIAPELMQAQFTKAADVFSFGITALELACNLALPNNGPLWAQLRNGQLPECLKSCSHEMQTMIAQCMRPAHAERPTVEELLRVGAVAKTLRRRRRWEPVRGIVIEAPQQFVRIGQRALFFVRRNVIWFAMRLLTLFSLRTDTGGRKDRPAELQQQHQLPNTPHRCHNTAGYSATPSIFHSNATGFSDTLNNQTTASAVRSAPESPMAQYISAMTTATPERLFQSRAHCSSASAAMLSTPSSATWPQRHRHQRANSDDDDDDGPHSDHEHSGNHPHEQLLLLDDSEIEGSPCGSKTPAQYKLAAGCGSAIVNSTPLTTHVLGGFRKSRRDVSAASMHSFNDSNHNSSAYLDGTSPIRGFDGTPKAVCTKRKKLFCNSADDSD